MQYLDNDQKMRNQILTTNYQCNKHLSSSYSPSVKGFQLSSIRIVDTLMVLFQQLYTTVTGHLNISISCVWGSHTMQAYVVYLCFKCLGFYSF